MNTNKLRKYLSLLLAGAVFLVFYQLVEVLNTYAEDQPQKVAPTLVRRQEQILLTNYLYDKKAVNKKYLRLFIESARYAKSVDFLIVGDNELPFELPPNVHHVYLSWDSLIDRLFQKVFDGKEMWHVRKATAYKVNDFKPLFAYLFPEYVKGYDWWGHVDNDIIYNHRQYSEMVDG